MSKIIESLGYNSYYKSYTAASCRATGLPMYGSSMISDLKYAEVADKFFTKSKCKQLKRPVADHEEPVAFLRIKNGYVPLFLRD